MTKEELAGSYIRLTDKLDFFAVEQLALDLGFKWYNISQRASLLRDFETDKDLALIFWEDYDLVWGYYEPDYRELTIGDLIPSRVPVPTEITPEITSMLDSLDNLI